MIDDGHGDDLLNLIVEVTGQARPDKVERVATARDRWVPGVNTLGRYGRWDFIEIDGPLECRERNSHPPRLAPGGSPHEPAQAATPSRRRRRSRRSSTRTSARTSRPTSCAGCSPTTSATRRRCSTRVTRASIRSSSGRARTSRTRPTSRCRSSRSTSRRRSHPRVIVENLRETAAAGEPEPELTLFDDFNGIDFEQLVDFYQHAGKLVEPADPRRLAARDDEPRREGGPQRARSR